MNWLNSLGFISVLVFGWLFSSQLDKWGSAHSLLITFAMYIVMGVIVVNMEEKLGREVRELRQRVSNLERERDYVDNDCDI